MSDFDADFCIDGHEEEEEEEEEETPSVLTSFLATLSSFNKAPMENGS